MIEICLILVALALGATAVGFAYVAHVLSLSVRALSSDLTDVQTDLIHRIATACEDGQTLFSSVTDRINDAVDEVSETIREKTSEFTDAIDEINDRIEDAYTEGEAAILDLQAFLDLQASRDDVVNTVIPDLIRQGEAAIRNAQNESNRLDREKLDAARLESITLPVIREVAGRLNVLETIAGVTGPEVVRAVLGRVEALEAIAARAEVVCTSAQLFVDDVNARFENTNEAFEDVTKEFEEIDTVIEDLEEEGRALIGDLTTKVDALTAKAAPKVRVRPSRAKSAKK